MTTPKEHEEAVSTTVQIRKKTGGGFADVAGMQTLKDDLTKRVIWVLKDKEKAEKYRLTPPNGMILYGPPGCGKTYFAEKFAEEAQFNFKMVSGSDLGSTYMHGTQGKIANLFKEAEQRAPVILCFDEFDSFVPARGSSDANQRGEEVNEFLAQLNNCSKRGIFVIGTTNRIELIDSARTISDTMSISNLLEYILSNSGLNELYRTDEEEERLENLNELIQSIKIYEDDHKEDEVNLTTYLQEVALYTNLDYTKSKNHVKVMTIHQSKGLEFPYVFISGLSDGIMPNKRSVRERKKSGMEEERRLMYVAVTRAEKKLFLTESEGYSAQGGFNKVPSRFIREIKDGLFVTEGQIDEDLWNRAAMFSRSMDAECGLSFRQKQGFTEGDEVMHDHFGLGTIRNIYDGGEYCEVDFQTSGLRSLKSEKLRKL